MWSCFTMLCIKVTEEELLALSIFKPKKVFEISVNLFYVKMWQNRVQLVAVFQLSAVDSEMNQVALWMSG